jgi:hypothetical protein
MQQYLAGMAAEFRRQNDWAVRQANAGADLSQTSNLLQGLSGLGSSLFQFGQSNNWWQSKPSIT